MTPLQSVPSPSEEQSRPPRMLPGDVAKRVIYMSLEEFERGLVLRPTPDDVSITRDGRRLDSKDAVLNWWAEVAAEIEADEAARHPA